MRFWNCSWSSDRRNYPVRIRRGGTLGMAVNQRRFSMRFGRNGFYHDMRDALIGDSQLLRGALREIKRAAAHVRSAIIDAHLHRFSVLRIRNHDVRSDRQRPGRSRHRVFVISLARAGEMAVKAWAIPRGHHMLRCRCGNADGLCRRRHNRGPRWRQFLCRIGCAAAQPRDHGNRANQRNQSRREVLRCSRHQHQIQGKARKPHPSIQG